MFGSHKAHILWSAISLEVLPCTSVTFSTRDTHNELDRKFKIKRSDDRIEVISREEYEDYTEDTYVCDCGTVLQYDKIENAGWCNTCIRWIQVKDAKKTVPFEIPVKQEEDNNTTPLVSCGDTPGLDDVRLDHQPDLKGGFLALSKKGTIRFTSYNEGVG